MGQILESLPAHSDILDGYDKTAVINRLKQLPLHAIEGVWQFVEDGAIISIERFNPNFIADKQDNIYRMVIIKSPMRAIQPGTIMGYITTTTKRNNYDAHIYTSGGLSGILSKPKTFTLTITDDQFMSFNEYKKELKVNLWRWLPYIYRIGLSIKDTRPKGLDGCIRIYPQSTAQPLNPRYL